MATVKYSKGLRDLGLGCSAWMQPDGGWGWSNAGLVTGSGVSLLVDTLFDLSCTPEMLDGMAAVTEGHPITTVVNTHSDGDHYFGNQLLAAQGAEIIASKAAADLTQDAVDELVAMTELPGPTGEFARKILAPFNFTGIESTDCQAVPPLQSLAVTGSVAKRSARVR